MSERVVFNENYNPFKKGVDYECLGYGYDFAKVKCNGKVYYVPIAFTEPQDEIEFEEAR